jgi:hypothetical protein
MLFMTPSRFLSIASIVLAPALFSFTLAQPGNELQYLLFEASPLNDPAVAPGLASELTPEMVSEAVTDKANVDAAPSSVDEQLDEPVDAALTSGELLRMRHQPPAEQMASINNDIARYKKVILDLEQKGGAYEASLSEELLALASLYQKTGDLREAQTVLNRAAHIARVNNGLYDSSQVPLLQKVIENYIQLGDLLAADRQQEALFYMQQRLYANDSPDLLPGLKYFAEWNLFSATTNITPAPAAEDEEGDEEPVIDMAIFQFEHLLRAQHLYDQIAQILIRNPGVDQTPLADAENKVLLISHLFATRYNGYMSGFDAPSFSGFGSTSDGSFLRRNDLSYRTGTDILQSRIARLEQQPNPDLQRLAKARIELADWLLISNRRMSAVDLLEETHEQLVAASVPPADLNTLFNPPLPQEIPTFLVPGYSRADLGIPEDALLKYRGYVDLEFEVNRFGNPSSIHVLGTSPDTDEEIPAHLVNYIRYSQFRPRMQDGSVRNSDRYQLRYHYSY